MTTQKKTQVTMVSLLAVLAAVGAGWGYLEPMFTWAFDKMGAMFAREQVQAVLASCTIGVILNASLPHWVPSSWNPVKTRGWAGVLGFIATMIAAIVLVPTKFGVVYAFLSALATPTAAAALGTITYWLRPCAKPESLKS